MFSLSNILLILCQVINVFRVHRNGINLRNRWSNPLSINLNRQRSPELPKAVLVFIANGFNPVVPRKKILDFLNITEVKNNALFANPALSEGDNRDLTNQRKLIAPVRAGNLLLFCQVKAKVKKVFHNLILNERLESQEI